MGQLFRISLFALALFAFATPNLSADTDRIKLRLYQKYKPGHNPTDFNLGWEMAEFIQGERERVCPDSGKNCKAMPPLSDSSYVGLRGSVKRVDGGFLITCEMMTPTYLLSDGRIVHDKQPWAGMVVARDQYVVYIEEAGEYEQLRNIVIDYMGSIVDENLNVTRFVAVR